MNSREKAKEAIRLIDEKYTYTNCVEWITELFEQHAEEQRHACIESANDALSELNIRPSQKADVILAVANATGEMDE